MRAGSDIVVIRRVSTCVAGSTDCDAFVGGTTQAWFQASLCASATELDSSILTDYYSMDTVVAGLTRHKRDCTTLADFHRFVTRIYFVANNDNPGDGIPTLKRAELGATGFTIVPLVEGIENLQYEYGLDTSATPDGAPDVFTADPDSYTGAGSVGATGNWRNAVAVRVNLLARNTRFDARIHRLQGLYARSQRGWKRQLLHAGFVDALPGVDVPETRLRRRDAAHQSLRAGDHAVKPMRSRQRGIVMVMGLIMLVLMTLLALTTLNLGKSSLQIVGNMQLRKQALAAAQEAIEDAVSTTRLFLSPTAVFLNPCAGHQHQVRRRRRRRASRHHRSADADADLRQGADHQERVHEPEPERSQ